MPKPDESTFLKIVATLFAFYNENYTPTLGIENVNQFTINYNGKKKVILKSKDFDGDAQHVDDYGEVITEGTFIYYLIDLFRETQERNEGKNNSYREKN